MVAPARAPLPLLHGTAAIMIQQGPAAPFARARLYAASSLARRHCGCFLLTTTLGLDRFYAVASLAWHGAAADVVIPRGPRCPPTWSRPRTCAPSPHRFSGTAPLLCFCGPRNAGWVAPARALSPRSQDRRGCGWGSAGDALPRIPSFLPRARPSSRLELTRPPLLVRGLDRTRQGGPPAGRRAVAPPLGRVVGVGLDWFSGDRCAQGDATTGRVDPARMYSSPLRGSG